MTRVLEDFFAQDPLTCARRLIGCRFEWHGCAARIVETEAYESVDDPACPTWFRPSAREFVQRPRPGDAYVYRNYGGREGFVLFRAVEPLAGIERMRKRRPGAKDELLGAGPGRLTRALGIDGKAHGASFLRTAKCGILLDSPIEPLAGPRIGISRAQELPWRFGHPGSRSLSRRF